MQRAIVSARRALLGLAAAICRGFCSHNPKNTLASAATLIPPLRPADVFSISGVLQFYEGYISPLRS
jgi:hypothetical protein